MSHTFRAVVLEPLMTWADVQVNGQQPGTLFRCRNGTTTKIKGIVDEVFWGTNGEAYMPNGINSWYGETPFDIVARIVEEESVPASSLYLSNLKYHFDFTACENGLPELGRLKGLTSHGVLFIVNDAVYAGYYHANGWFNESKEASDKTDDTMMAWGDKNAVGIGRETGFAFNGKGKPQATHWCYLRPKKEEA